MAKGDNNTPGPRRRRKVEATPEPAPAPALPSNVITLPLTRALSPRGTFARTMNGFEHDHYNGIVRLLQQIVRDPEDREDRLYRFVNVANMVASGQDKGLQLLMGVLAK